jgi:alpha-L-fucosidase
MRSAVVFFLCLLSANLAEAQTYRPEWPSVDARPTPQWFQDEKFGIFIHWSVYSVPAYAPVGKYAEWYWNHLSKGPQEKTKDGKLQPNATWEFHKRVYGEQFPYFDFAPQFRAEMFEPDQWADVFARSGAKYVVLTSKHHDGFALWPSKQADATWSRPWNAVSTGPKRDILGDLTNAVRAKGLRMGYYYSLYEWFNPLWKSDRKRYVDEHMIPQFKDLVTRYKPAIIFSDGEWDMEGEDWKSPEILAWLYNESPVKNDVVVNDRWGKTTRHKHGGYYTTEYTAGLDTAGHPWEESRGMGFSYGYNRAEQLKDYRSDRELILMLVDLVSRGGNLLLDIGPTADGRIPVIMQERLVQIGTWLKTNGESIYGTRSFKRTRQWSEGTQPKLETGEYMTRYEVTDYIERKKPGQAVIEAFFTTKNGDLYAIVPRWPGSTLVIKDVAVPRQVTLLGRQGSLKFTKSGNGVEIQLPEPPVTAMEAQHAYVLKLAGSAK